MTRRGEAAGSLEERKARAHRSFLIKRNLLLALLAAGLAIMLYPAYNRLSFLYRSARRAQEYSQAVAAMPEGEREEEWGLAHAYNEARRYNLFHDENTVADPFAEDAGMRAVNKEYDELLNPMGNGVMGYLDIPKVNQRLNVLHGTSDQALLQGVGHVQGTSLPVGGKSSHCVLSAHRGLPAAKLFTDLDQLEAGDRFYLHVLGHDLAYEVDEIQVVLPHEIESLQIVEGEDLVTLLTCTPYAVNTHRLLVRGHSVPYVPEESLMIRALTWLTPERIVLLAGLAAGIVVAGVFLRRKRKKRAQGAVA